jgi:flagellar motor switch protein FliN
MSSLEDDRMQPQFGTEASAGGWPGGLLMDLELPVSVRFGRSRVSLAEALDLTADSVLELDSRVADPVEVVVNNKVVARGNLIVVDGYYGVEIVSVPGARSVFPPNQQMPGNQEPATANSGQLAETPAPSNGAPGPEVP